MQCASTYNDADAGEIDTSLLVGSVRCVYETAVSPAANSPPMVPVTITVPPASAALIMSSAVMLSTVMVPVPVVSTVCVESAAVILISAPT